MRLGIVSAAVVCLSLGCGGSTNNPTDAGAGNEGGGDDGGAGGSFALLRTSGASKVDLLFMIDNSASMGDKQGYLGLAVPDLIGRLVQPNCVTSTNPPMVVPRGGGGACPSGSHEEFPAVRDMHIGVVTSSLGPRGSTVCDPNATTIFGTSAHNDDRGELINRTWNGSQEGSIADMNAANYLNWSPGQTPQGACASGPCPPPLADVVRYEKDFTDLISGVQEHGCGIESQLESWYRFLIQPDPYDQISGGAAAGGAPADWSGVDATILKQRHDFLRPDSLVIIIDVTDEDDSEINVRAFSGQGWKFLDPNFAPPRGTVACNTNPLDPACTSCGLVMMPNDPNCMMGAYTGLDPRNNVNLRHLHMKANYGIDPQFPLERYVQGLSCSHANDADPTDVCYAGKDKFGAGGAVYDRLGYDSTPYVGIRDRAGNECTNPLFAQTLPDGSDTSAPALCGLQKGTRTPDMVLYAHIGGVPYQLLRYDPNAPRNILGNDDWTRILGRDPSRLDYNGIDVHMIEATSPRTGSFSFQTDNSLTNSVDPPPAMYTNGNDNVAGHEWVTSSDPAGSDREFACVFALPAQAVKDCTMGEAKTICDCPVDPTKVPTPDKLPPLCDPTTPTRQTKGKAYPTIRELSLAHQLNDRGIVWSLCPIHTTEQLPGDPVFGYRPAVSLIASRAGGAFGAQCFPQPLTQRSDATVACTVVVVPAQGGCSAPGLSPADDATASAVTTQLGLGGGRAVCVEQQIPTPAGASCASATQAGWCYESGAGAAPCPQAIAFSARGAPPAGATVAIRCAK